MSDISTHAFIASLADQVHAKCSLTPEVAILLGTGLGGVAEQIEAEATIPYADITGMPVSTAASHKGEIVLGRLAGKPVIAFSGRLHCYEGYSSAEVVVPVRLAKVLGARALVMGSAVGGLNPAYAVGDLVLINDHINFMGVNPLVGPNDDALGPRWPDMIAPYDPELIGISRQVALEQQVRLHEGVYVSVLGPNLETRAEYRMLRAWGADIVGMSTVPEAIAAVHCGLKTLALAIVTDRCLADALEPADVSKIIAAANGAEPSLSRLIIETLARLPAAG